jgi:hypothetical protein
MASTATCNGEKYMALTIYAKTISTFTVSPSITFGAYAYKSDWATYFGSPTMPTMSSVVAVKSADAFNLSIASSIVSLGSMYYNSI